MKTNYFELYKKWMQTGKIDSDRIGGLCGSSIVGKEFSLMKPDRLSDREHFECSPLSGGYWGYDGEPLSSNFMKTDAAAQKRGVTVDQVKFDFTPMRQTIVLFCAAMADQIP